MAGKITHFHSKGIMVDPKYHFIIQVFAEFHEDDDAVWTDKIHVIDISPLPDPDIAAEIQDYIDQTGWLDQFQWDHVRL